MTPAKITLALVVASALGACGSVPAGTSSLSEGTVAGQAPASSGALDGESWRLDSVDRGPLAGFERTGTVTLGFAEGRAHGHSGCNRYFASYDFSANRLQLDHPDSTMMYCEGEANEVERAYLALLEQPLIAVRAAGSMELVAPDGTRLRFVPGEAEAR